MARRRYFDRAHRAATRAQLALIKKEAREKADEKPSPLELIGRLVVGSSWRQPLEGSSTKGGMQPSDIAAAVGYVRDPLARALVVAVGTRAGSAQVAMVATRAYRHVVRALKQVPHPPLDLKVAADRWRLRVLIYDVCTELVYPEKRQPMKDLAAAAKMRKATYCAAHKLVTAELQQVLNEAESDVGAKLWGRGHPPPAATGGDDE